MNRQRSLNTASCNPFIYANVMEIKHSSLRIVKNTFKTKCDNETVTHGIYENIPSVRKISLKQDQKNVCDTNTQDYVVMDKNINKHEGTEDPVNGDALTAKSYFYVDVDHPPDIDMGCGPSKCQCEFKPRPFNPKALSEDIYPFLNGQCYCYVHHVKETEENDSNEIYHSCENILNEPDKNELYDIPEMVLETFDKDDRASKHINCVIS